MERSLTCWTRTHTTSLLWHTVHEENCEPWFLSWSKTVKAIVTLSHNSDLFFFGILSLNLEVQAIFPGILC